jgi:hypothetical protein
LPAFEELGQEPNIKTTENGTIIAKESVVGLTTNDLAERMSKQGKTTSTMNIYESYLRPLTKQGVINSVRSIINAKENLYYPVNQENDYGVSILPLTEDCRLIVSKPFDEKKVIEESFRTLLERRSKGGGVKYKIIDIDGLEISLSDLLNRYFFNKEYYHTSYSVILTKLYNNTIEHYSIIDEQAKDIENPVNKAEDDIIDSTTLPDSSTNYSYTKEDIENFFDSDNEQVDDHTLEESICRPLIWQQNYKPFFYYCKEDPKVENINLISIENHIRLKDPQKHKAKLLEYLEKEKDDENREQ